MASSNEFYLQLKTKDENYDLKNAVNAHSTVIELQHRISELTGILVSNLKIIYGYPRKPLDVSSGQVKLDECGIKSGTTLYVEESDNYNSKLASENVGNSSTSHLQHILDNDERKGLRGVLLKKVVPSDNSCLFTSIHFVVSGNKIFSLPVPLPVCKTRTKIRILDLVFR